MPGIFHPKRIATALVTGSLVLPAFADSASTQFTVGIRVAASVALDVVEQPATVTLTPTDLALGYKDVAVRYRVRHNDRRGYLLRIEPHHGIAAIAGRVEMHGPDGDRDVPPQGIEWQRPGDQFDQELAFNFHVVLDRAATTGTFEWPLRVVAATL